MLLMKLAHPLATLYAGLVAASAGYAWVMDVRLLYATTEHLLPDLLLAAVTLPASLTGTWMFQAWPGLFSQPLVQTGWLTLCGAVQVTATFLIGRWMAGPQRRPHTSKHRT